MRRPSFTEAQRRYDLQYARDHAIAAVQAFAEAYHGTRSGGAQGFDTLASFHEAYERHQGKTRTAEKRVMSVRHTQGCGETFTVQMPGPWKLVDSEGGRLRSARMNPVQCPSCGKTVRVKLPEGMAIVKSDEQGDPSTRQDGRGGPLGMDSEREPDEGSDSDAQDALDDRGLGDDHRIRDDDEEEPLHPVRGDDAEDEEEDEDEEESEGDEDEEPAGYRPGRGVLPDRLLPKSGPFRPGSGVRDSVKGYYADRPEKLVRLAKQSESTRVREAARTFLRVLNEGRRFNRPV